MRLPMNKNVRITSPFGMRTHPTTGVANKMHNGIDLVPQDGTATADILAVCDGVVSAVVNNIPDSHTGLQTSNTAGNYVIYETGYGYRIKNHHLKAASVTVKAGQKVKPGDVIGKMGATGNVTGVHLHYEICKPDGTAIDPAPYLGNDIELPLPTLKRGDKGEAVKLMQGLLAAAGYKLEADGSFGAITETILLIFQADKKLAVDGRCGPATWTALQTYSKPAVPPEPPVHWAAQYRDALIASGITITDERYDDFITRGETFALLSHMMVVVQGGTHNA